ncbi:AI-2E family transporter [Enterococcus mundtii]|uniref:AI-2E family transporter n=1 Tax=Enterococcus TaxID=1350 RepID=UPI0004502CD4|nr:MULTISPECIES: AI-2E family transporter [Enterococcus]AZP93673.1 AI-2E family transporter [Enterococcus mundtii]EYT96946.1 membrane protein [Enterococcus mundtii CRL35]MDA9428263.1 putative membrane protein [Enterococcus mundtii 1A]MDK4210032.1 AI-2E family transporter [Enterococcus mundtii]MDO7878395.1 AI-2E family transporter [Enterococcus mundtii]
MYSRFKESKLLFWTVELVLTIIGVFFILRMPNVFHPILRMASAIIMPLIIAGFFYYMFNPVVLFLEKHRVPRVLGYLLTLIVLLVIVFLTIMNILPQLVDQAVQLTSSIPAYADETSRWLTEIMQREEFRSLNLEEQFVSANLSLSNLFNILLVSLTGSVSRILSFMMQFFILLFTVPFILLFMFKDGHKFIDALSPFFPQAIRGELRQTVRELNETLSAYISSTIVDAVIIGVMSFIAMTIFKQPYSLLLAVVCGVTNIIPYVGPFIGAVPAIIVGLFISPFQALYMALSILVIQQLDGNVIKPLLFGKTMNIHPLTIILVLIGAGSVAGIMGMLICIPVYAVIKTLVLNIRKIYLLRKFEQVPAEEQPKKIELEHE